MLFSISIEWHLGGLVRMILACGAEFSGFEPWLGSPIIFKIDFHQQKLNSLLITCDVKLEGILYSVLNA